MVARDMKVTILVRHTNDDSLRASRLSVLVRRERLASSTIPHCATSAIRSGDAASEPMYDELVEMMYKHSRHRNGNLARQIRQHVSRTIFCPPPRNRDKFTTSSPLVMIDGSGKRVCGSNVSRAVSPERCPITSSLIEAKPQLFLHRGLWAGRHRMARRHELTSNGAVSGG